MASPVVPQDFKEVVSDPSATLCGNFINTLLKLPTLVYKLVNWMLDADGNLTDEFRRGSRATGTLEYSAVTLEEDGSRLLCDGRAVSRTTYATLRAAMEADGFPWGVGDGLTTFNIPDFRARFLIMAGTLPSTTVIALGATLGEETHILDTSEGAMDKDHVHTTGRMETDTLADNPADDVWLLTGSPAVPPTGATREVTGDNGDQPDVVGTIQDDAAGAYTVTSGQNDPLASIAGHNTIPPARGVLIYIAT